MDNKTIRRKNIEHLSDVYGGTGRLAEHLQREQAQVSQWIGGKGIGDRLARALEAHLDKPVGWLDHQQWPGNGDEQGASYGARLSVSKVVGTTRALRTFLRRRGLEYDPVEDAELFVAAYAEADKLSEEPSQDETLAFASVVVDLIQEREARRNGSTDGGQVGSGAGSKDRKSGSGSAPSA